MKEIVPLDKEAHKDVKIRSAENFAHVAEEQLIPLTAHEVASAATEFPVVFVKDSQTGQFHIVALCGLKPKENLYTKKEKWDGNYIPLLIRNYPLLLTAPGKSTEQFVVCIDQSSSLVSRDEGEPLFNENGEQTDFLKARYEALVKYATQAEITNAFIKLMVDWELLVAQEVNIDIDGGEDVNLKGFYIVNEKKLNELDDSKFGDLRRRGFLSVIYGQLLSLNQVYRLVNKKETAA